MESLDLTQHGPEEFEGKLIVVNDCDYIIGAYLGIGAAKIVHKLINRRSGLCLHVIKFWRSSESAATGARHELAAKTLANALGLNEIVPDLIEVQAHGGFFELQEYIGPYEDKKSRTNQLMQKADRFAKQSDMEKAIPLYEQILQVNPAHTVALHNLAFTQAQSGNIGSAFLTQGQALEIEPNWLPYQSAYVRYAAGCGHIRAAIGQFEMSKAQFAFYRKDDDLGIELYLVSGDPRKAQEVLKESMLDRSRAEELQKSVKANLAAKSRAAKFIKRAKETLSSGKLEGVLDLTEKAYSTYEQDPFTAVNLGFALLREGNYKRAKQLLLSNN